MPTKNPRVNVTFEATTVGLLSQLATRKNKSVSSLVKELTIEALEMYEDLHLVRLANELDKDDIKTHSHAEAWK